MKQTVRPHSMRAWILAARPKTLPAAAVPVLLGCALALAEGGFRWIPALLCLLFALLMQIDANLINDLFDYRKGSDRKDRLGPERACAQGWISPHAMKRGIALITATACATGLCLLFYGGTELIVVGSSALVASSQRMIFGLVASARAMATRCCWPPESWLG